MYKNIIGVLLASIFVCVKPVFAVNKWPDITNLISSEKLKWHDHQTTLSNGVPVTTSVFSSKLQPIALAELINNNSSLFQRVLAQNGHVVLSGVNNGWHWLANITAVGTGSQGYISALQSVIDVNIQNKVQLPLVPKILDNHFQENGQAVHQQIFKYKQPVNTTQALLINILQLQGWDAAKHADGSFNYKLWRRGVEQLVLVLAPKKAATYVFIQHFSKSA